MDLGTIVVVITGLVTVSQGIRYIWKKLVVPMAELTEALPDIKHMAAEMRPNGGGSLKDKANDTNKQVQELTGTVKDIVVKMDTNHSKLIERLVQHEQDDTRRFDELTTAITDAKETLGAQAEKISHEA